MSYECVSCKNDTNGFCMRGVYLICRECVIKKSTESIIIEYENKLKNYIKEKGISYISEQLYQVINKDKKYINRSMLNNTLFLDAVFKIYGKPYNILELDEVVYKRRDYIIDELLK